LTDKRIALVASFEPSIDRHREHAAAQRAARAVLRRLSRRRIARLPSSRPKGARKGTLHQPNKWLLGGETAKHNGSSSILNPTGDLLCLQLEVGEGLAAGFV